MERDQQFLKIINFLIDFIINLCYNEGGKNPPIAHSQQNKKMA